MADPSRLVSEKYIAWELNHTTSTDLGTRISHSFPDTMKKRKGLTCLTRDQHKLMHLLHTWESFHFKPLYTHSITDGYTDWTKKKYPQMLFYLHVYNKHANFKGNPIKSLTGVHIYLFICLVFYAESRIIQVYSRGLHYSSSLGLTPSQTQVAVRSVHVWPVGKPAWPGL